MEIELRHLRQFLEIAAAGSYRGAAQRLFVAQPALSVSIRKLEEAVGALSYDADRKLVETAAAGV